MDFAPSMATANFRRTISKLTIALFLTFISFEGLSWGFLRMYPIPAKQNILFGATNGRDDNFILKVGDDGDYEGRSLHGDTYKDSSDRVFEREKQDNVIRIICLGASETYGVGADRNHSYPALLESILNASIGGCCGIRFEVVNAGFMGYHSWHSRVLLVRELLAFNPDYVSIMQGPNDLLSAALISSRDQFYKETNDIVNATESPSGWFAKDLSRLDSYATHTVASYRILKKGFDILFHLEGAKLSIEEKLEIFGYSGNVEKIIDAGSSSKFKTLVLNYPWIVKYESEARRLNGKTLGAMTPLYEKGQEFFDRNNKELVLKGALLVDALRVFGQAIEQSNGDLVDRLYHDEVHLTKHGNSIIAREIVNSMLRDPSFRSKICEFDQQSLDSIMTLYHPHLFFLNGWPDDEHFPQNFSVDRYINVMNRVDGPPGWVVGEVIDKATPGYIILRQTGDVLSKSMGSNGIYNSFFYPRVASSQDSVRVADENGNTIFQLSGTYLKSSWTGVSDKFGLNVPASSQGRTLVIEISGNAQLWHSDKGVLFTNDTKHPGY